MVAASVLIVACFGLYGVTARLMRDPFTPLYAENCSVCHGESLEGGPLGTPLVGRDLLHGDSIAEIVKSISDGFGSQMPAWSKTLDEGQIRGLAILISERRSDYRMTDLKIDASLVIPEGTIESERHAFRIESVASGLHPWPFSIAPLPDGRILLTEKMRGLSIIAKDGEQSELIREPLQPTRTASSCSRWSTATAGCSTWRSTPTMRRTAGSTSTSETAAATAPPP